MNKQAMKRNYVAVTIAPVPRVFLLDEGFARERTIFPSPISHSWARHPVSGIIGIRFCSWMINHGPLPRKEKAVVSEWNKSESDFEVFFGDSKEYDHEASLDDAFRHTSLLLLNRALLGVSFPLFGPTLARQEIDRLEAGLMPWAHPDPEPEKDDN